MRVRVCAVAQTDSARTSTSVAVLFVPGPVYPTYLTINAAALSRWAGVCETMPQGHIASDGVYYRRQSTLFQAHVMCWVVPQGAQGRSTSTSMLYSTHVLLYVPCGYGEGTVSTSTLSSSYARSTLLCYLPACACMHTRIACGHAWPLACGQEWLAKCPRAAARRCCKRVPDFYKCCRCESHCILCGRF